MSIPCSGQATFKMKFRVERQILTSKSWYEVMLSPFETLEECNKYIEKYKQYYPIEDRNYRITEYEA